MDEVPTYHVSYSISFCKNIKIGRRQAKPDSLKITPAAYAFLLLERLTLSLFAQAACFDQFIQ